MYRLKGALWAASMFLVFSACTGSDGPAGPPGVPNMTSKKFNGVALTWTDKVIVSTNFKVATLSIPEITQDVIDRGLVMVYAELPGEGATWSALPYSYRAAGPVYSYGFVIDPGTVELRFHRSDNVVPGIPSSQFRIVVVPPTAE